MNTITKVIIVCSVLLFSRIKGMDAETMKFILLLTPWTEKKEVVCASMQEAELSGQSKEVVEIVEGETIKAIFNPRDKIVTLSNDQFSDSFGYDIFKRWIGLEEDAKTSSKQLKWRCILQ